MGSRECSESETGMTVGREEREGGPCMETRAEKWPES